MTVEEIEILVTAKVTEALREFKKIMPVVKEMVKQSQEAFSKIDMKAFNKKIQQTGQIVRKQIENIKKSVGNNEIAIKVTNKDAKKVISQTKKSIDSLKKQTTSRV